MVVIPEPLSGVESEQDQVIASRKGIKYFTPDLTLLDNMCPTKEMKDLFQERVDFDHMIDEVVADWEVPAERESEE